MTGASLAVCLSLSWAAPQAPAAGTVVPQGAGSPPAGQVSGQSGPVLPAGEQASEVEPPQPVALEPWPATFAQGVQEVLRLAASEQLDGALAVTDQLLVPSRYEELRARLEEATGALSETFLAPLDGGLTWLGLERLRGAERGELRYLRGLLQARKGAVVTAEEDLQLARSLAGEGRTRRDAVYALGTLDLMLAEVLRQKIPEISGNPPQAAPPGAPQPPGSAGAGAAQEPDPLDLARAVYTRARGHLVERLRMDWDDADTQANIELIQRRLRELEEIERQREEQEQNEQPDQQDQDTDDQQDRDPEDQQESEDQQDREDQEGQEEPQDDPEQEPEQEPDDEAQEAQQEQQEVELTEEEFDRLLKLLREHQEEGQRIQEALARRRRERVKRDW